jgi:hypothetical protein
VESIKQAPNCPAQPVDEIGTIDNCSARIMKEAKPLYFVHKEFCLIFLDSLRILADDPTQRQAQLLPAKTLSR